MLMIGLCIFFAVFWAVRGHRSLKNNAPLFVTVIYGVLTLMNIVMIFALLR
jgi:hypothetical protein